MVYVFNAGMPDSPASDQFSTGMDKMMMPETVRYQNKRTPSSTEMPWYLTEIQDDTGMPMPSYGCAFLNV